METKTLRELMELAEVGKKFIAWQKDDGAKRECYFKLSAAHRADARWTTLEVLECWHYEEIRELAKLEFEASADFLEGVSHRDDLVHLYVPRGELSEKQIEGKKFKVTMTEVQDD